MATLIPAAGPMSPRFDGREGDGSGGHHRSDAGGGIDRREPWIGLAPLWFGRGAAFLLAIFWGLFFVEHLSEWYFDPRGWPPVWVTLAMVAHGVIILGLAGMLRWSWIGAALTLVGTIGFMAPTLIGGKPAWLMLVNVLPVALVVLGELRRGR